MAEGCYWAPVHATVGLSLGMGMGSQVPGRTRVVLSVKQCNLRKAHHKAPNNGNLGFRGGHGPSYMGVAAIMWVPMGAQAPALSPNDLPNQFQRQQKGFIKNRIFEFMSATKLPKQR